MATAEYNFFRMNDSGVVDTARRLPFADDSLATAHARDLAFTGRIEIWSGKRRVGVVPAAIDRRHAEPGRQPRAAAARV